MQAYAGDRGRRIASSSAARRHKAHCDEFQVFPKPSTLQESPTGTKEKPALCGGFLLERARLELATSGLLEPDRVSRGLRS
jgi:hypothetical protein